MTSQKSSANKLSASFDFKRALKSMIFPSIVSFLVALYFFVIRVYSTFSTYMDRANPAKTIENIRNNVVLALTSTDYDLIFGVGNLVSLYMGVFAIIAGVLFAFTAYVFLMRKKCVNVYLSIGVNRKTIYKNRTIAGMLLMAVSAVIPIIIDIVMNIHFLGDAGYIIYHGVFVFIEYYTYMLVGFSMMSITMMLCNTIVECLFFGAGFIWAPTVLVTAFNELCYVYLRGYNIVSVYSANMTEGRSMLNHTSIINPVFFGKALGNYNLHINVFSFVNRGVKDYSEDYYISFTSFGREYLSKEYIIPIIIWLAVSSVFIFIARQFFLKRKAENAGLHGVKTSVNVFVALELSLLAAVATVAVLASRMFEIHLNSVITMIIAIAVFAVVYFILMSISKRKIKQSIKTFIPAAVTAGAVCITAVILSTGGFGYTDRTPAIEDIDYAMISSYATDAMGNESPRGNNGSYRVNSEIFSSVLGYYIGSFTDEKDLQKFIEIHKSVAKKTDNMTGNTVRIIYRLKDGSKMQRTYYTTDYDACYNVLSLTDSDAYHKELEYLLSSEQKDNNEGGISKDSSSDIFTYISEADIKKMLVGGDAKLISSDGFAYNDIKNTDALRDAVLADRLAMTYNEIYKPSEKPLGYILFMDQKWYEIYSDYGNVSGNDPAQEDDYSYEGVSQTITFYIYPSMANTINYLKSTGEYSILKPDDSLERYNITSARIMKISDFRASKCKWDYIEESDLSYLFERSGKQITTLGTQIPDDGWYDDGFEIFNDGMKITDSSQLKELSDASRIFGYAEQEDYIVCFQNDDGVCYTSLIRVQELPDFVK